MNTVSKRFVGKVAFVTGAGSGIGRATALRLAQEGADVVVIGLVEGDNDGTTSQIQALGQRAMSIRCDVTDSDAVAAALAATVDAFGGLDIAFNNAGIEQRPTPLAEITDDQWDRVIDVNLRGVFVCMRAQIP